MSKSSEFKPIPYSFLLTDIFDKPLILDEHRKGDIVAHCPPFHILLDHTIAVLWILFSSEFSYPLNSAQISWALNFLEGMTNDSRHNAYAIDVQSAIECLQNALVNCISRESPYVPTVCEQTESETATPIENENKDKESEEYGEENSQGLTRIVNAIKSILLRSMLSQS